MYVLSLKGVWCFDSDSVSIDISYHVWVTGAVRQLWGNVFSIVAGGFWKQGGITGSGRQYLSVVFGAWVLPSTVFSWVVLGIDGLD